MKIKKKAIPPPKKRKKKQALKPSEDPTSATSAASDKALPLVPGAGSSSAAGDKALPEFASAPDPEDEEEDAEPDPDAAAEPIVNAEEYTIKERGGWKVAYTKPKDDLQKQKEKIINRIRQKRNSHTPAVVPRGLKRAAGEVQAASDKKADKRKALQGPRKKRKPCSP